jgi:hypothetical protein
MKKKTTFNEVLTTFGVLLGLAFFCRLVYLDGETAGYKEGRADLRLHVGDTVVTRGHEPWSGQCPGTVEAIKTINNNNGNDMVWILFKECPGFYPNPFLMTSNANDLVRVK